MASAASRSLILESRRPHEFGAQVERVVAPYGIVAKAAVWFLVGARPGQIRVYRASRIREAEMLDEPFERPVDFNLAVFWKEWCAVYEAENQPSYLVTARVSPEFLGYLPHIFGESIRAVIEQASPPDAAGWVTLILPFQSLEAARDRLLGFGRAVEVLEPLALRKSMQDFAGQIASVYTR